MLQHISDLKGSIIRSFIQCLAKITVILAKQCIKLPDDGSLVIRNMLEHF